MSVRTTSRLAGFMFLFYIITGIAGAAFFAQATSGDTPAAKLASIGGHLPQMRLGILFTMITIFDALILAVALYRLTQQEDPDLALIALGCRIAESVTNIVPSIAMLVLLWLATATASAIPSDSVSTNAIADSLLKVQGASLTVGATAFAAGSTIFSYLFLRARSIPLWLAYLGLFSSILLIVTLPLEGVRLIHGPLVQVVWLPMLVFEVTLGGWLLFRGANVKAIPAEASLAG